MDHSEVKHFPKVDHTPAELDKPAKLLLKTAALIEERGHCQNGTTEDSSGRMCVIAAMTTAYGSGFLLSAGGVGDQALRRLEKHISGDKSIPEWSDSTPTQEVLSTMRAVALGL